MLPETLVRIENAEIHWGYLDVALHRLDPRRELSHQFRTRNDLSERLRMQLIAAKS